MAALHCQLTILFLTSLSYYESAFSAPNDVAVPYQLSSSTFGNNSDQLTDFTLRSYRNTGVNNSMDPAYLGCPGSKLIITNSNGSDDSSQTGVILSTFYTGESLMMDSAEVTSSVEAAAGNCTGNNVTSFDGGSSDSTEVMTICAGVCNCKHKKKKRQKKNKKNKNRQIQGESVKKARNSARVESFPGKFPFLAVVKYKGIFHCIGSIISPKFILSSRHWAATDSDTNNFMVSVGVHNLVKEESEAEQNIPVKQIHIHPNLGKLEYSFDFGIYELQSNIKEKGRLIQMIALPHPNTQLLSGGECFVVGWGKALRESDEVRDDKVDELMAVEPTDAKLSLISYSACEEAYGGRIDHSMICAGYKGERGEMYSPKGDRGGPLVCRVDRGVGWIQAGVVSWGIARATLGRFGVFARVTAARPWIKQISNA